MNERTLPDPLSGDEIIAFLLVKVRTLLQQDCYLSPNAAYDAFSGEIEISLKARDIGRVVDIERSIAASQGDTTVVVAETAIDTFGEQPPNVVREESHQPIPVLVSTVDGKSEIKRVSYAPRKEVVRRDLPEIESFEDEPEI